jgi:hypothetical protein
MKISSIVFMFLFVSFASFCATALENTQSKLDYVFNSCLYEDDFVPLDEGKELHLNSLIKPDHFIFISLRYL